MQPLTRHVEKQVEITEIASTSVFKLLMVANSDNSQRLHVKWSRLETSFVQVTFSPLKLVDMVSFVLKI